MVNVFSPVFAKKNEIIPLNSDAAALKTGREYTQ